VIHPQNAGHAIAYGTHDATFQQWVDSPEIRAADRKVDGMHQETHWLPFDA